MVWAVALSTTKLSPRRLTSAPSPGVFVVWLGAVSSRPLAHPAPYPPRVHAPLPLKAFRGEPAISGFDWYFTPTHSSSPRFATLVGSGLHAVLPALHPGHG